jgi:AraC-like DNA-binding protein
MTGKSKLKKGNPLFVKDKKVHSLTGFLANELGLQAPEYLSGQVALKPLLESLHVFIQASGQSTIPFRLGDKVSLEEYGFLGYAVRSCENIRQAVMMNVFYFSALTNALTVQVSETKGVACVSFACHLDDLQLEQYLSEIVLAGLYSVLKQLSPDAEASMVMHFRHPEPAHVKEYLKYGNPRILFNQPSLCVFVPSTLLDQHIGTYDPNLQALAESQLQALIREEKASASYSEQVTSLLRQSQYRHQLSSIAGQLHLSERTLKRYLAEEKSSFRQLLNQSRCEKACELLIAGDQPINHVAQLLGYSSSANFCYAFKQWTALSPAVYREVVRYR